MKRIAMLLLSSGALAVMSGAAMADQAEPSIRDLPDKGQVTVSGTVDRIENGGAFMLRDHTGSIKVKIISSESAVFKQGDNVTVNGTVERPLWGLMGKDISATNVQVHKDLPMALSDAITKTTGMTMEKAEAVQINKLPDQGMVKLTGTVDKVSDSRNFTLKDTTGTVDVSVQSDQDVVLAEGAEVTVTGYVKSGALGKNISATHVILVSNAPADTGAGNMGIN